MIDIKYNPATRKYEINGKSLPSVTDVLMWRGCINGQEYFTDAAKTRGSVVHQAVEYLMQDDLDDSSIDPVIRPRLDAFKKFRAEMKPKPIYCEKPFAHKILKYCGHLDLLAAIGRDVVLIDIKTGPKKSWHSLQLAGYAGLIRANSEYHPDKWIVLNLRDDATYRIHEIEDHQKHWELFCGALALTHYLGEEK